MEAASPEPASGTRVFLVWAITSVALSLFAALLNSFGGLVGGFAALGIWGLLGLLGLVSLGLGGGLALGRDKRNRSAILLLSMVPVLSAVLGVGLLAQVVNNAEFWLRKEARERAAEQILAQAQTRKGLGASSDFSLPQEQEDLSDSGQVVVLRSGTAEGVYFWTARAILRGGTGYLYSSSPELVGNFFDDARPMADRWWAVSED